MPGIVNPAPTHTGWWYDKINNRLYATFNGERKFYIDANGAVFPAGETLNLAGVTALSLPTTSMSKGTIPLPLAQARLIASNDIAAKNAADGGIVSLDTAPTFKRINAATDKNSRISWAAAGVVPIQWSFSYPVDLDDTAPVVVHLLMGKDANTDTAAVVGVAYFEGVGDTNAGGNTAALAVSTVADYTVTIAASDIGAYPNTATVELIPGTHGSDAEYLYAAWIEYTRKTA